MRSYRGALLAASVLLSTISGSAQEKNTPPELVVAAAADLSAALKEIGDSYEKKTGVKATLLLVSDQCKPCCGNSIVSP